MLIRWKVFHHLVMPIPYESGPTSYPVLGATLTLDASNIMGIDHELLADQQLSEGEVADLSTENLVLLWELLSYRWGFPVRVNSRAVERIAAAPGVNSVQTQLREILGVAAIQHSVRLPDEAKLVRRHSRLSVWLRLANEARRPTLSSDAIRNYYMISEDINGQPTPGSTWEEMKFVRDFVSHGGTLGSAPLLAFLQRELGAPTDRFDPVNPQHQHFLDQRREWARLLIEAEIEKYL